MRIYSLNYFRLLCLLYMLWWCVHRHGKSQYYCVSVWSVRCSFYLEPNFLTRGRIFSNLPVFMFFFNLKHFWFSLHYFSLLFSQKKYLIILCSFPPILRFSNNRERKTTPCNETVCLFRQTIIKAKTYLQTHPLQLVNRGFCHNNENSFMWVLLQLHDGKCWKVCSDLE